MKTLLTTILIASSLTTIANPMWFQNQNESEAPSLAEEQSSDKRPWFAGANNEGDNTHIYIPDNYDYEQMRDLMVGSGFGPGNGGNQYIFEVDSIIKKIIATLKVNAGEFPEVTADLFTQESPTIGVFFVKDIPGDRGRILEAANFPQERAILINGKKWRSLSTKEKIRLIFHEYLGIMGIERENSNISNRITNFIHANDRVKDFEPLVLKYLYSRSNTDADAYGLTFNSDQTGKVVTNYDSDSFRWKKIDKGVNIQLSGSIVKIGFPVIDLGGVPQQVETTSTLLELELNKLTSGYYEIIETWKSCYQDPSQNSSKICSFDQSVRTELIGTGQLNAKPLRFEVGDLLALPISQKDSDLSSTHLVRVLENNKVETVEALGNERITNLWLQNRTLHYETSNGSSYQVSLIKRQNGIDRAFYEMKNSNEDLVGIAPIVLVKGSQLPILKREDVVGELLPIYSGARHTSEDQSPYFFNDNAVGGFDFTFYDGDDFVTETTYWSWSLTVDNKINAKRYVRNFYDRVVTPAGVLACVAAPNSCKVNNDRDYVVLKKNGNRYTMLRLYKFYTPDEDGNMELRHKGSDLWVMDKL